MRVSTLIGLAASIASQTVSAACSGPLKIDDFSRYSQNQNSLNEWTSGMFDAGVPDLQLLIRCR